MNSPQKQGDPGLALQYLAEVASQYAQGLDEVAKAPFINQVNSCMRVLQEAVTQPAPAPEAAPATAKKG